MVLFFALFIVSGICLVADPVEGYWLSVDEKTGKITAGWHIYQEGGKLFGKILSMVNFPSDALAVPCKDSYAGFPVAGKVSQMRVIGTPWIFGLSSSKPGEWSGGSIINAQDGKMYKCKITYRAADGRKYMADVLVMRGEIGLGIGRSQFWQKSDQQAASSLK
jgi:uncharacterized protein (DUF2147 family)